MNAQVFTTTQSAASASATGATPSLASSPSISSPSTWFLGQPRLTRWTFMAGIEYSIGPRAAGRAGPRSRRASAPRGPEVRQSGRSATQTVRYPWRRTAGNRRYSQANKRTGGVVAPVSRERRV